MQTLRPGTNQPDLERADAKTQNGIRYPFCTQSSYTLPTGQGPLCLVREGSRM